MIHNTEALRFNLRKLMDVRFRGKLPEVELSELKNQISKLIDREEGLQELADQAQELNMGYGSQEANV